MKTLRDETAKTTNSKQGFVSFIFHKKSYWFWIMIALSIVTFITISFIPETGTLAGIRYVFAFIFVAFLPGYSLTQTLFPKEDSMDLIERTTFSIGISFAITALTGLFLSFTPFRLTLQTALPTLGGMVIVLAVLGLIRTYQTQ
ncbi:MAG: DUF1616 domain-containing protein [Candidatus Bathyarchaeia archaeon]